MTEPSEPSAPAPAASLEAITESEKQACAHSTRCPVWGSLRIPGMCYLCLALGCGGDCVGPED